MSAIAISLASLCEKSNGNQNQENLWICPDLSRPGTPAANDDTLFSLSSYGAIMVVANPLAPSPLGEKATEIAVNTIYSCFTLIPSRITRNDNSIRSFLGNAVAQALTAAEADDAATPPISLVAAWLVNGRLHLAWTGDAHAYVFNPANGMASLIAPTDGNGETLADSINILSYPIHRNDIFITCSDDIAAALTPQKLEKALLHTPSLVATLERIWNAAGSVDDATIALMRVADAPAMPLPVPQGWRALYAPAPPQPEEPIYEEPADEEPLDEEPFDDTYAEPEAAAEPNPEPEKSSRKSSLIILWMVVALALIGGIFFALHHTSAPDGEILADSLTCTADIDSLIAADTTTADTAKIADPDTIPAAELEPAPAPAPASTGYYNPPVDDYVEPTPAQPEPKNQELTPHGNFDPNKGDDGI